MSQITTDNTCLTNALRQTILKRLLSRNVTISTQCPELSLKLLILIKIYNKY